MMKDPSDILLMNLDNQGKCEMMTKEQVEKAINIRGLKMRKVW